MDVPVRSLSGHGPKALLAVFLLALVPRLLAVFQHLHVGLDLRNDPSMYLTLAENLRHGVFSMFHPLDIPDTIKMPGYPLLIRCLGGNVTLVLLLQTLVSAAKAPMVSLLAMRVGITSRFALGAGGLMALEPVDILLSAQVMTETWFTAVLLGAVLLLARGARWTTLLASACLFATAAWIRPNGVWLVPAAAILGWFAIHRSWSRALVFLVAGLLLVLPWALRNQRALDRFYLGDGGVVAAAYYQVPDVLRVAGDPATSGRTAMLRRKAAATDWEDRPGFHAFFNDLRAEAWSTFRQHPVTWLRVQAMKALRIYLAPGRGHVRLIFRADGPVPGLLLAWSGLFIGLLVLALPFWIRWAKRLGALRWSLLLALAMLVSGSLTTTDARFKNPAMPLLLVGVAWVAQRLVARKPPGGGPISDRAAPGSPA